MKVKNREEAWEMADKLFPTDYVRDEILSKKEGYPVYVSTQAWKKEYQSLQITDLKARLEVNDGIQTFNIWIEEELMTATVTSITGEFQEYIIKNLVSVEYTASSLTIEYLELDGDTARTTIDRNGNAVIVKIHQDSEKGRSLWMRTKRSNFYMQEDLKKILERAKTKKLLDSDEISLLMDIESAIPTFNIDLKVLNSMDDFNFAHDIIGIQRNINRECFPSENFGCFVPRSAKRKPASHGETEFENSNNEIIYCWKCRYKREIKEAIKENLISVSDGMDMVFSGSDCICKRLVIDVKYDDFCSRGERVSQVGTQEKGDS